MAAGFDLAIAYPKFSILDHDHNRTAPLFLIFGSKISCRYVYSTAVSPFQNHLQRRYGDLAVSTEVHDADL